MLAALTRGCPLRRQQMPSWAKAQGLFAGLSLDGSRIFKRDNWNNKYYGFNAQSANFVLNGKWTNKSAQILRDALTPYRDSGRVVAS